MKTVEGLYDWQDHKDKQKQRAQAAYKVVAESNLLPVSEADILDLVEVYNQNELAAHNLKRIIFDALHSRRGYRMLRIGQSFGFDGTDGAYLAPDEPELMVVESLGVE